MTDAADLGFGTDLHGAGGHVFRPPKFKLIAVGIGEVNHRAVFTLGGTANCIAMRHFEFIEPAQMILDILLLNIKTATRQFFSYLSCRRENLRL